jgi:FKBP-type peptidyl-prolyl cis-trans isomerase 2
VIDPFTGSVRDSWLAFEEGFRGGVNAILVDLDGDGVDEVAAASGTGRVAEVRFFDLRGNPLAGYPPLFPFGERYEGGLNIAGGDLDADGDGDLVVAKAHGAGDVKIYESRPGAAVKLVELTSKAFRPFPATFQAGATVAVGDVGTFGGGSLLNAATPDRRGEIIIGNGPGSGAEVLVYDISFADVSGTPRQVDRITPFSSSMRGGVAVSAGRFNADAIDDVFVAGGRGAGSVTEIYDGTVAAAANVRLAGQAAFGSLPQSNAPVFAAGLDIDGDNRVDQLFATQGLGGGGHGIRRIAANGSLLPLITTVTQQLRPAASPPRSDASLVTTTTGLQYRDTKVGGAVARAGQTVRVHYVGSSRNGTVFDSSRDVRPGRNGSPFEFRLGNREVIAGWDEGVAGMRVGGQRTLIIPANLAYEGQSGRPQGTLVFDVELISIG